MENTTCAAHSASGLIRDMDGAMFAARDLFRWAQTESVQGWLAEIIVTFNASRYYYRCCPAAMNATYLTLTAYRVIMSGRDE